MSKLYNHDCDECIYLGSNERSDFYFCDKLVKRGGWTSLIIRNSNKPEDYFSMPAKLAKELIEKDEMDKDSLFAVCYRKYLKYNV